MTTLLIESPGDELYDFGPLLASIDSNRHIDVVLCFDAGPTLTRKVVSAVKSVHEVASVRNLGVPVADSGYEGALLSALSDVPTDIVYAHGPFHSPRKHKIWECAFSLGSTPWCLFRHGNGDRVEISTCPTQYATLVDVAVGTYGYARAIPGTIWMHEHPGVVPSETRPTNTEIDAEVRKFRPEGAYTVYTHGPLVVKDDIIVCTHINDETLSQLFSHGYRPAHLMSHQTAKIAWTDGVPIWTTSLNVNVFTR